MKDLGPLTNFLGFEVYRSSDGYMVNQHKYIHDLITFAGLFDNKHVDKPLEINVKYSKDEGAGLLDPALYRQLVGSLVVLLLLGQIYHIQSRWLVNLCLPLKNSSYSCSSN